MTVDVHCEFTPTTRGELLGVGYAEQDIDKMAIEGLSYDEMMQRHQAYGYDPDVESSRPN